MKRAAIIILALLALTQCVTAANLYYNVTMNYDKGNLSLESLSIVPLKDYDTRYYRTINDYTAVLLNNMTALNVYYFDFNLKLHAVTMTPNGDVSGYDITLDKNTISAYFPYNSKATEISIMDNKLEEALKVNLKQEAKAEAKPAELPTAKPVVTYILAGAAALVLIVIFALWIMLRKKD